jgi:peptidoglycan/LPS O-acetylase OafA/YrhL
VARQPEIVGDVKRSEPSEPTICVDRVAVADISLSAKSAGSPARLPELDGLRGLAILLVLVFHYVKNSVVLTGVYYSLTLAPLRLTWSGVQLFFVLSGFLIGGILLDTKSQGGYYRAFFGRRFHRIFPLYYVWFALFLVGLSVGPPNLGGMFNATVPPWSYPLYLQNVVMSVRGSMGAQWLFVTWSLAVEEQFYLVLPVLIRKLDLRTLERLLITAIIVAPIIRGTLYLLGVGYSNVLLLGCADCLGSGVLIAACVRRPDSWLARSPRRLFCWTFLILACGVLVLTIKVPATLMFTVGYTWIGLFYANLLILTIIKPGNVEKLIFRSKLLVWMGTVSYGIYIFHEGIRGLIFYLLLQRPAQIDNWSSLGSTALAAGTTFLLAEISWRFFERPIVQRGRTRYTYGKGPQNAIESRAARPVGLPYCEASPPVGD